MYNIREIKYSYTHLIYRKLLNGLIAILTNLEYALLIFNNKAI